MNEKVIIYDSELMGHHLEYIHHLWMGAGEVTDMEFTFVIPGSEFDRLRYMYKWPKFLNVKFRFLSDEELSYTPRINILKRSRKEAFLIKKVMDECQADRVFMVNMKVALPFLLYKMKKGTKLDGIIYDIYSLQGNKGIQAVLNMWRYKLLAKNSRVGKVFILNSKSEVDFLNKKFKSSNFHLLVDPVPVVDKPKLQNIREFNSIMDDEILFLHFGALDKRKGTLELLKALMILPDIKNKCFAFLGKIHPSIKEEFYEIAHHVTFRGVHLIVEDKFVDYDYLNSFCASADCILAPYTATANSSGVIGYGAVHSTPVIGSDKGLLGELIRDYHLGITLAEISPQTICEAIANFKPFKTNSTYAEENSLEKFQYTILST